MSWWPVIDHDILTMSAMVKGSRIGRTAEKQKHVVSSGVVKVRIAKVSLYSASRADIRRFIVPFPGNM